MDFRTMLMDAARFSYFTDQEKEYLLTVYLQKRRSDFSRSNLLYILAAFTNYSRKSLFEIRQADAAAYTSFLISHIDDNSWKEQYALTVFNTIRSFYTFCYTQGVIKDNPFGALSFPVSSIKEYNVSEFSSLASVDLLFSALSDNPCIYLAAALAFRMALTISDLVGLKREQFGVDEQTGDVYLYLERKYGKNITKHYLFVPEDLHDLIQDAFRSDPSSIYLFPSKRKGYLARSSLQVALQKAQAGMKDHITFSDLRNLSIFFMLVCSRSKDEVAAYAGLQGNWLTRYSSIPDKLRMDAARYVNLRLVDPVQ